MLAPPARWLCLGLLLLAACGPAAETATTTPGATPSVPPPTAVPTPTLAAQIGRPQLATTAHGRQVMRGILTNQSDQPVEALQLSFEVFGLSGSTLAAGTTAPLLPWLAPGAASPYQFHFTASEAASSAEAHLAGYRTSDRQPALIEIEIERVTETVDGGARALGWLQPPRTAGAQLDGLALAAFDGGALGEISTRLTTLHTLAPGRPVPFEAAFDGPVKLVGLTPYVAASAAPIAASRSVVMELDPGLQLDDLDHPFLTGILVNQGDEPAAVEAVLALSDRTGLQRVLSISSAVPLAAGERRPFGVAQLALPTGAGLDGFTLEGFVGTAPTGQGDPVQLTSAIVSFERIGGSVFLRGTVENGGSAAVPSPTLFAAVRSTDGQLWTAGSLSLAESIAAGDVIPFVLDLPLPAGADLPAAEFDIRALGVPVNITP